MTTAHPVAFYLKELTGEPGRRAGRGLGPAGAEGSALEREIAEAHARGVLEGRAAAQAEHDAALGAQAAAFEKKLAAERQRWSAEEGQRLAQQLGGGLDDIERRVAEHVAAVLKPVLAEAVRTRAVAELARTLNSMLTRGEYARITVSGPQDLLAALEARLGVRAGLALVASEAADLRVDADETILETSIGAWIEAIRGEGESA